MGLVYCSNPAISGLLLRFGTTRARVLRIRRAGPQEGPINIVLREIGGSLISFKKMAVHPFILTF
jgi:hypothetical protein